MNKSKVALFIVGIFVLCGGLVAGLLLVQQNQKIAERAAPATTMFITPGSQNKLPGSSFTFTVGMDTADNAVTGVDVRLNFDPSVIQITSLTQGSGIVNLNQVITNTYDNTSGKIAYAVFTLNSSQSISGSNIQILTVNATIKQTAANGSYKLTFDPASAASASQEGQNVITSMSPGTIIVGSSSGTTAPTATATPTRSPSPSPVPTGNHTATPTAVSTSNATTTPTITSTPRATATSMPIPVTGTDWTTYLGIGLGITAIIGAIFLAI
jgi:hypothetical protein